MTFTKNALIANAASFGFHWVYDSEYLFKLAESTHLLFKAPDINHYNDAKSAYYGYPFGKAGDVTTQGMMLYWLYSAIKEDEGFSQADYSDLLYEKMQPGGEYIGYIETYTQKLILNRTIDRLRIKMPKAAMLDDHLVGFVPYFVAKDFQLSNEWAWDLAQLFTDNTDYLEYFKMIDELIRLLPIRNMKKSLQQSLEYAPSSTKVALSKALEMQDTAHFIDKYAGIACQISQSIPLIYHILSKELDFEETIKLNTLLGGASSERGMLLGAVLSTMSPVPADWSELTNIKIE